MSQLDFSIFLVHYLDIVTMFYIFICLVISILAIQVVNRKLRRRD